MRDGYTQTLKYNASHQLAKVTDSFGRVLSFTYSTERPAAHAYHAGGLVLTYGYSGIGPGLTPAELHLGDVSDDSPDEPDLRLLRVRAAQGHHQSGRQPLRQLPYDGFRIARPRCTPAATRASAPRSVSYNDADGSRAVTDANGLQTVYEFTVLQGVPKVTEIDRQPSAGPATTSKYTYDANGYVASYTDWNGDVTNT